MAELKEIIMLLMNKHMERREQHRRDDTERMEKQRKDEQDHFLQLLKSTSNVNAITAIPKFAPFYPTAELWADYYDRFAHSLEHIQQRGNIKCS